ncbi:expressed unknown protein [Seminavis robusta]|uniref:Uncharacterized protein n=1 Tax=Seminavis robusta TaxID=568900 RepID=A0A9N8HAZ5_9STRA|nr:expressed unknown protein [Seminavis robusta]|eukprot:Sro165_g073760.1 n/a (158) ;mRNA; f:18037-18584
MFTNIADGLKVNQTVKQFTMRLTAACVPVPLTTARVTHANDVKDVMKIFADAMKHNYCLTKCKLNIGIWVPRPTGLGSDYVVLPLESWDATRMIEMYTKLNQDGLRSKLEREECNNPHLWTHALGTFADDLDCIFTYVGADQSYVSLSNGVFVEYLE